MNKAFVASAVLLACSTSLAETKPVYPDCILENLKAHANADNAVIFNVTKLCLMKEEQQLPQEVLADLRPYTSAGLVFNTLHGVNSLRVTIANKSKYIITSATVNISFRGESYSYVTRFFNAVYHSPVIITDAGVNFLEQMTIPPNETREFDIVTTFNAPVSTKISWDFIEITGIAP